MSLEELINKIRASINAEKDATLTRIANGVFATTDAAGTGMAYQHQRGVLLGLVHCSEIVELAIKEYSTPKAKPPEGNEDGTAGTQPAADTTARPHY